jgi:hypothetical protein
MKTNYTAGSWHTQGCTIYAGKNRVAQTWDAEHDSLPTCTMLADARLIAAAPELLTALEGVLEWWMESDGGDDMPVDLFDRAQAAISKAKGGAL